MIAWWGPIILEYYGMTEGLGFTACDSAEWLAHRGTVGKVLLGELHVLDENMKPCPAGTAGTLWFKTATPFEYFNDPVDDGAGALRRRHHEHGRRRRLCRRGGLSLSHRPRDFHDHLRRGEHLSAGMREPAHHPPEGRRRRGIRRTERRSRRGGEGRNSAHARHRARSGHRKRSCWHSAPNIWRGRNVRARSISKPSCRGCRPASSTSACYATATGRDTRRELFSRTSRPGLTRLGAGTRVRRERFRSRAPIDRRAPR